MRETVRVRRMRVGCECSLHLSWIEWLIDLMDLPAMASPVRATRALAPGGSFICPYTRAALDPGMGLPVALSTASRREWVGC